MKPTRPILRYHGGKWRLAPWVISHFPAHSTYVEPFGGAASVLLQKQRTKTEVWNDLNSELYTLFAVLRDGTQAEKLITNCFLTPFAREEFDASYEPTSDPVEMSRRMIVRSFFGFGSKSSLNKKQNGFRCFRHTENSPAIDWAGYPQGLQNVVERLRGVVIEHQNAIDIIRRFDRPTTLFYCDPPYIHAVRKLHQGRYQHEMTDADHEELSSSLQAIQGMAIISGYPSPLYDSLYKNWLRVSCAAYADMNVKRTECLWISPNAQTALPQRSLLEVTA